MFKFAMVKKACQSSATLKSTDLTFFLPSDIDFT